MSEAAAVEHRRALVAVSALATRDLRRVFRTVVSPDAGRVRDGLMDTVPLLAAGYGTAAGALASDYYDEVRDQAAVRGRFRAEPALLPGTARYEALVRWGVDPLFAPSPDDTAALGRLTGGLQRIVTDAARATVVTSAIRDPAAEGWIRVTAADSCSFCQMLADRRNDGTNGVYTEASVTFKSHDNCNCAAAPAWQPGRTVSTVPYRASRRNVSDADRARVREYLAANY